MVPLNSAWRGPYSMAVHFAVVELSDDEAQVRHRLLRCLTHPPRTAPQPALCTLASCAAYLLCDIKSVAMALSSPAAVQPGGARDAARVRPPGTVITGRAPSLKSGSVSLLDIIEAGLLAPGKDNLTISYKWV